MSICGEPEILRCSLTSSILNLRCSGLNLEELDLLDKPDQESSEFLLNSFFSFSDIPVVVSALKTLWVLRAINDSQNITPEGRLMALFPLEPQYACAIVASEGYHCTSEVLDIVSILSASTKLFFDVSESRDAVADVRQKFRHQSGDHMTILNAFHAYRDIAMSENKYGRKDWCRKHFLNERTFIEAKDIREQLAMTCKKAGMDPMSSTKEKEDPIIRSLGHGLVANSALLQPDGSYKQTMGQVVSCLYLNLQDSDILYFRL